MNQPSCIHTSTLMAGRPVEVYWAMVPEAQSYVLDRRLTPLSGIGSTEGDGEFTTVYTGAGSPYGLVHVGLPWDRINAYGRSFHEIGSSARSWDDMAALGDRVSHVMWGDAIPEDADTVEYRVKAVGVQGEESPYRHTERYRITRFAGIDDSLTVDLQAGDRVLIPLSASMVMRYPGEMVLRYDSGSLRYEGFSGSDLVPTTHDPGALAFQYTRELDSTLLSGQVALLEFAALGTTVTELKMFATGN